MPDVLQKELAGEPVTVCIRDQAYPLAYPMHALILYKQKTGESLVPTLSKIAAGDDDRWLVCLWAGLHYKSAKEWKSPFTVDELREWLAECSIAEADQVTQEMAKAIKQSLPKAKEPRPNAEAATKPTGLSLTPPGSMPAPAAASELAVVNS